MRQGLQILVIAALFAVVGVVTYRLSGAGDPIPAKPVRQSQYPSRWLEDLPAAQAQARTENKLILVDFQGSDWCRYCIQFHDEIADTPEFQAWAAQRLVLVNVDFPRHTAQEPARVQANRALAERYAIEGFPTLLLLNADGTVLARLGYRPGGLLPWLAQLEPFVTAAPTAGEAASNAGVAPNQP